VLVSKKSSDESSVATTSSGSASSTTVTNVYTSVQEIAAAYGTHRFIMNYALATSTAFKFNLIVAEQSNYDIFIAATS